MSRFVNEQKFIDGQSDGCNSALREVCSSSKSVDFALG